MFHNYIFYAFCLICMTMPPAGGYAQRSVDQSPAILPYHFHKIAQENGLSSYNVRKIVQDEHGYTWIATQDGLNRYDGKHIIIYNKTAETPLRLVNNDIWDLAEDTTRHLLWVLSYSGLNSIDLNTGRVLPTASNLALYARKFPNGWLKCLQIHGEQLWIGSKDYNGLTLYNIRRQSLDTIEPLPPSQQQPAVLSNVDRLWTDPFDRVWAFVANYGIVVYSSSGRIVQRHPLEELGLSRDKDFNRFRSIVPISTGLLALATDEGLFEIRYDRYGLHLAPYPLPSKMAYLAHKEIYYCATDPQGRLWFGSGGALYRLDFSTGILVEIKDTDYANPENWFGSIFCIFFDRLGHIWIGSQKGLTFSTLRTAPFLPYFQSADFTNIINHVNFTFPYKDSLLFACAEDGLFSVNTLTNNFRRLADGRFVFGTQLHDGRLLFSAEDRLYVLQHNTLVNVEKIYPELAPIDSEAINSLVWCGDTLAVMGSDMSHGIFCWNPGRHTLENITDSTRPLRLKSGIVNLVYHDHRGRIWVLSDASWCIYDPARRKVDSFQLPDPLTRQPLTFYFDATEAGGLYWLAVYGTGLIGLDSSLQVRRVISTKDGLANAGVYKVFAWQDSVLFVTSNSGLARIRLSDLSIVNYFLQDGLNGNSFEEDCGYFDGHYIYAGGERGLSRIEPGAIPPDPSPPPLRIAGIHLQTPDTVYDIGDISMPTLDIPSDVVQTNLTLSTFNYTDADRTLLSYRIPELNTQWTNLPPDRTIRLLGLSPGDYTLQAKAANPNSPGSQRELSLTIRWLPKWYQTLWFKLLVLLVLLSLLYLFYRYRISQIRKQHLIRQTIASDLHDDIGSILNTIKIFTHLARVNRGVEIWLTQIDSSLAQAVVALRDMIWILDDSLDTVYEFTERIRQFATPVTSAQNIHFEVTIDPDLYHQDLPKAEKRNLLLITKESINNCIKYSSCTNISISVGLVQKAFTLAIEDNGIGFDTTQTFNGNGLKNIRQRAAQIRYTVEIDSAQKKGTRITLTKC